MIRHWGVTILLIVGCILLLPIIAVGVAIELAIAAPVFVLFWLIDFRKVTLAKWRRRLARRLRYMSDRLDVENAPKAIGFSFTYEHDVGVRFRDDGRGCPLWYASDADHERAHTEADTRHMRVDWVHGTAEWVGGSN